MANKENQEALDRLHTSIYKYNCYSGYGNKGSSIFEKDVSKLQQALDRLELVEKALDRACAIFIKHQELNPEYKYAFNSKEEWKEYLLKESEKQ